LRAVPTHLEERVNLNSGLSDRRKGALSTLASATQPPEGTRVLRDVELGFAEELLLEVLKEGVVEVLTTQVGVSGSRLHGEDTASDVQERNIESSSTEVEDEDVLLGLGLPVEAVCDSSRSRLVDDTEDVKTSDSTGVLGGQTLRIVEVCRYTALV
jgi:hypothetical protein